MQQSPERIAFRSERVARVRRADRGIERDDQQLEIGCENVWERSNHGERTLVWPGAARIASVNLRTIGFASEPSRKLRDAHAGARPPTNPLN
jgi:hypothetical protein